MTLDGFYHPCSRCRQPRLLLAATIRGLLCFDCWERLGHPPAPIAPPAETFEQEQATRERMKERGGSDRYRVAAGKA